MSLFLGELDLEDIDLVPSDGVHGGVLIKAEKYVSKAGKHSIHLVAKFTDEDDDFFGEDVHKYISFRPDLGELEGEERAEAMKQLRKFYLPALRQLGVPEAELLNPDLESLVGLPVDINGAGREKSDGSGKEWNVYSIKKAD